MSNPRWQRAQQLYHAALERPASARAAFLRDACAGDEALLDEVQSLLDQPISAEQFLVVGGESGALDTPQVSVGQRLGVYQVQALIGRGGMGEVYRARDTKLGRNVAVKLLPRAFAKDPNRLARLEREARALATLNHPHIAAIYGFEDGAGVRALVLELVEGETLDQKLGNRKAGSRGLPLAEAFALARQIADALDAAHEKGIVHRDLKPANIKITPEGNVKVLDFGLAKVREEDGSFDLSTVKATTPGAILGTVPYMSPEQASGKEADRTSDVWAFGCVLYEMLAGRRPFEGESAGEILASILKADPDWRQLPAETPDGIRRLLHRCLRKDPKQRIRDIRDARLEIDDVQSGTLERKDVARVRAGHRERLAWASVLALVTLSAAVLSVRVLRPVPTPPESRLEIQTPPTSDPSLAISPDGLKVVFAARSAGESRLWLRSLDSPVARPLERTERASSPFWSPDGRSIGFFADNKLKSMDIDRGSVRTLVSVAPLGLGGAWNGDGTIVFSTSPGRPLFRISVEGGEPSAATRFESPQQRSHSSPQFLPDGRRFLFFVDGSPEARGVYLGQLDGLDSTRLFDAEAPAVYASTGHLLFIREGKLLAQDFDPHRLETRGDAFPISDHVTASTRLSTSPAGPIVYQTPSAGRGERQLQWVDRSGREVEKVAYADTAATSVSVTRDGRRIAVLRLTNENMDIWSYDTNRRTWDRLTFGSSDDISPLWSPDGSRIVFGSRRGEMNIFWKLVSAAPGSEELLLSTSQPKFPTDWSSDGRMVLYDTLGPARGLDIWALPLEVRKPFEVVQTDFNERLAQFSPDGKWIAYQSDKTGREEVYVQPFPGAGGDSRVSTDGGAQVRWNPNGRELFYVAAGRLMAVPMHFVSDGKAVEPGAPLGLFDTSLGTTGVNVYRQQYAVSPDGQSFVLHTAPGDAGSSPIMVILNWDPKR